MGGNIVGDFSLPSFNQNFLEGKLINEDLNDQLIKQVQAFEKNL